MGAWKGAIVTSEEPTMNTTEEPTMTAAKTAKIVFDNLSEKLVRIELALAEISMNKRVAWVVAINGEVGVIYKGGLPSAAGDSTQATAFKVKADAIAHAERTGNGNEHDTFQVIERSKFLANRAASIRDTLDELKAKFACQ